MAISDSTSMSPPYVARAFVLRGVEQTVTHTSGGKSVTRTAVVDMSPTTFLERGGTRKTSTATVTFLEAYGVLLTDQIRLPDEPAPRKVIRVTGRYGLTVQHDGFLTEVLLV